MQVVGTGFGRTGTLSLKHALEQLGFGPCYHMEEALKRPADLRRWAEAARTGTTDWDALLGGWAAGVDYPVSAVWRELVAHWPEAKVLHTVRDPERWWESTRSTIYLGRTLFPRWATVVPPVRDYLALNERLLWGPGGLFDDRFLDRGHAVEVFERHTAEVVAAVPAERLLVYEVAQGWEPLCAFLGVPVPDAPFPRLNDTASMRRKLMAARWGLRALPVVAGAGVLRATTRTGPGRRRRRRGR